MVIKDVDGSAVIRVKLVPRANRDEIVGLEGDLVKIRVHASPVEGQANAALCKFLAAQFGIAKSNVEIIAGHSSRIKRVRLRGVRPETVRGVLDTRQDLGH